VKTEWLLGAENSSVPERQVNTREKDETVLERRREEIRKGKREGEKKKGGKGGGGIRHKGEHREYGTRGDLWLFLPILLPDQWVSQVTGLVI